MKARLKVTDLEVIMEMSLAEARVTRDILSEVSDYRYPGSGEVYDALYNVLRRAEELVGD